MLGVALSALAAASPPAMAVERGEPEQKEAPKKDDPNAPPGIKPAPGAPAYLTVPLFVIPVIEGGNVTRTVSVGIGLELVKGKTLEDVKAKEAVLMDAFFQELYGLFAQRASAERIAQPPIIKARLMRVADRILGPGVVSQILILQLFERPKMA